MAILSTLESTTLDKTIRWASKWLTLTNKQTNKKKKQKTKKKENLKLKLKLKQNKTKQNKTKQIEKQNKTKQKQKQKKNPQNYRVDYSQVCSLRRTIFSVHFLCLPQRKALISKLKFGSPLFVRKLDYRIV